MKLIIPGEDLNTNVHKNKANEVYNLMTTCNLESSSRWTVSTREALAKTGFYKLFNTEWRLPKVIQRGISIEIIKALKSCIYLHSISLILLHYNSLNLYLSFLHK